MIRLSELKLPLAEVPTEHRRAADAPTETDLDREPPPHPVEALTRLAAAALDVPASDIAHLHVFKRSFDARKADLLAVYIVDVTLADADQEAPLLAQLVDRPHIQPTPDM
ncbi:MAG: FAD-dependent oxidoreductase, partial [Hydrogenophaga sp.]|nr:FAD-dependent oxidoreductase [Hydrogenophaga sp.]